MNMILVLLLLSISSSIHADIYKHTDSDGKVTYSDSPSSGEKIELDKALNISSSISANPSWSALLSTSKKIQIDFKRIGTLPLFSLLSDYAKKHDDITLRYEIFHGKNMPISYNGEPWAKIVQHVVSGEPTYFMKYDRKNRILTIYDHPI